MTEPCLVVYEVQFLRLRCYCLSAQPVFRKVALLLSARRSNFRSIFFCWHLSEGRQLQEIPIYKVRALINYMIFLRVLQSFPCASDRRFPRAVWRKTRQKWFPWISSQNKIICFSYRCGQYRDSELWEFWTVSQSDLTKTRKDRGSSSVDDAYKKLHLQKDSGSKVQNRRSSRIPITTDERRSKVHTKVNLPKTVKTARKGKPIGGASGMFFSSQPHFFFIQVLLEDWEDLKEQL